MNKNVHEDDGFDANANPQPLKEACHHTELKIDLKTPEQRLAHDIESADVKKSADVQLHKPQKFDDYMLSKEVLKGLKKAGFVKPSPIQHKAIPIGLLGLDMVVQAKSGTGKTCVFVVNAIEAVNLQNKETQVIILAPTREIADQIHNAVMKIGAYKDGLTSDCFIGGTVVKEDRKSCKNCHIAIGTTGRICQLVQDGDLKLEGVRLFIIDEADKMMEEAFQESVNWLFSKTPFTKQVIVLSATYPRELDTFLSRYMRSPAMIQLNSSDVQLIGLKQYAVSVCRKKPDSTEPSEQSSSLASPVTDVAELKMAKLLEILSHVDYTQCLVFCNYQSRAEIVSGHLQDKGIPAMHISAFLKQNQRLEVMDKLRNIECRVVVSTDLTARGIDAENVNLVVNYDIPYQTETYLHRVGRAGRYGGFGAAVSLFGRDHDEFNFSNLVRSYGLRVKLMPSDPIPHNLCEEQKVWDAAEPLEFDVEPVEELKSVISMNGSGDKDDKLSYTREEMKAFEKEIEGPKGCELVRHFRIPFRSKDMFFERKLRHYCNFRVAGPVKRFKQKKTKGPKLGEKGEDGIQRYSAEALKTLSKNSGPMEASDWNFAKQLNICRTRKRQTELSPKELEKPDKNVADNQSRDDESSQSEGYVTPPAETGSSAVNEVENSGQEAPFVSETETSPVNDETAVNGICGSDEPHPVALNGDHDVYDRDEMLRLRNVDVGGLEYRSDLKDVVLNNGAIKDDPGNSICNGNVSPIPNGEVSKVDERVDCNGNVTPEPKLDEMSEGSQNVEDGECKKLPTQGVNLEGVGEGGKESPDVVETVAQSGSEGVPLVNEETPLLSEASTSAGVSLSTVPAASEGGSNIMEMLMNAQKAYGGGSSTRSSPVSSGSQSSDVASETLKAILGISATPSPPAKTPSRFKYKYSHGDLLRIYKRMQGSVDQTCSDSKYDSIPVQILHHPPKDTTASKPSSCEKKRTNKPKVSESRFSAQVRNKNNHDGYQEESVMAEQIPSELRLAGNQKPGVSPTPKSGLLNSMASSRLVAEYDVRNEESVMEAEHLCSAVTAEGLADLRNLLPFLATGAAAKRQIPGSLSVKNFADLEAALSVLSCGSEDLQVLDNNAPSPSGSRPPQDPGRRENNETIVKMAGASVEVETRNSAHVCIETKPSGAVDSQNVSQQDHGETSTADDLGEQNKFDTPNVPEASLPNSSQLEVVNVESVRVENTNGGGQGPTSIENQPLDVSQGGTAILQEVATIKKTSQENVDQISETLTGEIIEQAIDSIPHSIAERDQSAVPSDAGSKGISVEEGEAKTGQEVEDKPKRVKIVARRRANDEVAALASLPTDVIDRSVPPQKTAETMSSVLEEGKGQHDQEGNWRNKKPKDNKSKRNQKQQKRNKENPRFQNWRLPQTDTGTPQGFSGGPAGQSARNVDPAPSAAYVKAIENLLSPETAALLKPTCILNMPTAPEVVCAKACMEVDSYLTALYDEFNLLSAKRAAKQHLSTLESDVEVQAQPDTSAVSMGTEPVVSAGFGVQTANEPEKVCADASIQTDDEPSSGKPQAHLCVSACPCRAYKEDLVQYHKQLIDWYAQLCQKSAYATINAKSEAGSAALNSMNQQYLNLMCRSMGSEGLKEAATPGPIPGNLDVSPCGLDFTHH